MKPYRIVLRQMNNEGGFVLVGALLILVLLIVIGIAATTSTFMEIQIAGSDRTHKETFYAADGGTQVASELIEQSISCPGGFLTPVVDKAAKLGSLFVVPKLTLTPWANPPVDSDGKLTLADVTDDLVFSADHRTLVSRNAFFNYNVPDVKGTTVPRIDMQVGGAVEPVAGGALEMLAGYEGKGKSAAGGGSSRLYAIHSLSYGNNNSESWIITGWRHVVGQEGACNY